MADYADSFNFQMSMSVIYPGFEDFDFLNNQYIEPNVYEIISEPNAYNELEMSIKLSKDIKLVPCPHTDQMLSTL